MNEKNIVEIIDVPLNGGEIPLYSQYFQYEKRIYRRLLACIIDFLIVFCVVIPYAYFVSEIMYGHLDMIERELIGISIFIFFYTVYHYYLYRFKCTTIGKRIFSLRVYQYGSLESLTLWQVFFREIIFKIFTVALFPSSLIHFLIQKEGLTVHDLLAQTMVVIEENPKETHPSKNFFVHHSD